MNVFYYQSSYGGRVYFDALGPPWRKHPCTDRNARREVIIPERPNAHIRIRYTWQDEDWSPIVVRELSAESAGLRGPFFTVVHGTCEEVEFSLHVIEESLYERLDEDVSCLLAHARFEVDGSVSLSFLDNEAKEFRAVGFRRLSEAKREYEERKYGRNKGRPRREQSAIEKALSDAIRKSGDSKEM